MPITIRIGDGSGNVFVFEMTCEEVYHPASGQFVPTAPPGDDPAKAEVEVSTPDMSTYLDASVKDAELITYNGKPRDSMFYTANAIDTKDELRAFRKTAYEKVDEFVKNSSLPDVEGKRARLKKIYNEGTTKEYEYTNIEQDANAYWQRLVAVVEEDKRAALTFDEKLLERLELPEGIKLIGFRKCGYDEDQGYLYTIELNGIEYDLRFSTKGKIELYVNSGRENQDTFFVSETKYTDNQHLTKTVSLADLKRESTFKILCAHNLDLAYPQAPVFLANGLIGSFLYIDVPVRSTDPVMAEFVKLRDRAEEIREEFEAASDSNTLTREKYDALMEEYKYIFAKASSLAFDVIYDEKTGEKTRAKMVGFRDALAARANDTPHLADKIAETARYKEELDVFLNEVECQNLQGNLKVRAAALPSFYEAKFGKYDRFRRLDKEHQEAFLRLVNAGWSVPKDLNAFLKAFALVPNSILFDYAMYLTRSMRNLPANSELVKDPITLIWFTQATAGMDINQFYAYSGYYALHSIRIVSRSPEEVARAVKSFKDRDELSLVSEFLYDCSINTKKMKEYVARAKLLVTPEFTFEELRSILNRFSDKSGRALYMLERLDEDYIKNWLKIMMKNLPDYVEKIDFDALNSLKPCQREALRFLEESQYVYTNAESVVNIFNPLIKSFGNISNEYEAIYVGRNIDSGSYFPGQAVQDAASHAAVWKAMADAGIPKDFDSSLLSNLFSKGIPDDVIIKILGDLSKLSDDGQKAVFRKYVTAENACALAKELVSMKEDFTVINRDLPIMYAYALGEAKDYHEHLAVIKDLSALRENSDKNALRMALILVYKVENFDDVKRIIEFLKNQESAVKIANITKQTYANIKSESEIMDLVALYFHITITPKDLPLDVSFYDKLQDFIDRADREKYDLKADPSYVKARMLVDDKNGLEKEDTHLHHISYILNVLQDSSEKYSAENIQRAAIEMLESDNENLREKGAKLLIGQGNIVQNFNADTVRKIAKEGVDEKLTQYKISEKMTDSQLEYLSKATSPRITLSLYFSILVTMEKNGKSGDEKEFERLVGIYDKIKDRPVYTGELLVVSHNVKDGADSFLKSEDSFDAEAHETFAGAIGGEKVTVLRHDKDGENVESMFSMIEMKKRALTIVVGGHGSPGKISYGSEVFSIDRLFESLAKRVASEGSNEKWPTTIIFSSCHSDVNAATINKMWKKDERTKGHPITIISSSNENEGSAKMADDAWLTTARKFEKEGRVLTFADLYREIESKSFIMSYRMFFFGMNSNMTVFVDGEEVG